MNAWIYGAGAVGSLTGGILAAGGHRVTLVGRPALLEPVRARGLTVRVAGRSLHSRPGVASSLEEAAASGTPDLILLTMKSFGTAAAAAEIAARWPGSEPGLPVVLTLQNGIGNEEALAESLGPERVWSGALTIAVSVARPGEVTGEGSRGGFAFAPLAPDAAGGNASHPAWGALLDALRASGVAAQVVPEGYRGLKWSKLLLNLLGNAACAALDLSPAQALADPRVFRLEREAWLEALRVMRLDGIRPVDLPGYPVRLLARVMSLPAPLAHRILLPRIAGGRGGKLPSFLLDLRAGRRTEVSFLNGAVAARARALGLSAPVNAALTELLDGIAAGTVDWAAFRGRPERLASRIGGAGRRGSGSR